MAALVTSFTPKPEFLPQQLNGISLEDYGSGSKLHSTLIDLFLWMGIYLHSFPGRRVLASDGIHHHSRITCVTSDVVWAKLAKVH